jgi:hypothetical protein
MNNPEEQQQVGQLYAQFAKDLHEGTHVAPDFNMPYHTSSARNDSNRF